jgi:hypothetical protein
MTTPARIKALEWEIERLGVRETPPGSNRGPAIDKWNRDANGLVGEPWCMSFQHAAFAAQGVKLGGWAGVQSFLAWASQHGYEVTRPFRGDLVCLDWNGDRWYDHVGMVERVLGIGPKGRGPWLIATVEGNTNDMVARRRRLTATARFCRVPG